jgi:Peptidase C39 family
MSTETGNVNSADPGLSALVMLSRFHGVGADPEQIRHRFGRGRIGIPEMLRCAKELGLKARSRLTTWERLVSTPMPAIVALRDGGFLLLGKVGDGKALVQSPLAPRPTMMTRAEFEAAWDGHLVLMTRRAGLVDLSRRFDITWFLGAIHKYRRLLGEVLVASFAHWRDGQRQRRRWPSSHRARPFSASSGRKTFRRPVARAVRFFRRACLRSKYQPAVPSSRRSSLPQSLPFIPNVEICCVCQSTSVIARSIACVAWEYSLLFGLASQV